MNLDRNSNKLVSYSRAGDVFHYRWAARRCLKLIQPTSNLELVIIEGSKERKKAGEYVIDVAEYYKHDATTRIEYYQLKHTTVQANKPFTLCGLKTTIEGFSKRYQQHCKEKSLKGISFTLITNRPVDQTFKENLTRLISGVKVQQQFIKTIKKYTKLDGKLLIDFCNRINLADSEGDYKVQKEVLRHEMAMLQPGTIDPAQVASIVSLVQEKVLPDSDGIIRKEEVLRPFGVTAEEQLFPSPPLFDSIENITVRKQYQELIELIKQAAHPIIIHAEGGVGKSVFCKYLLDAISHGSFGVAYDCFGSGEYRRRSKPRHRHRDALVQISNELASTGLCERMLVKDSTQDADIVRYFLIRIKSSLTYLKKTNPEAKLLLLIDAADNAEMAADEFNDVCFVNELLREEFPEDCRLILLCRSERIHLLKAPDHILQLKLLPFSKEETFKNLLKWYPDVNEIEANEFHRLTNGNPRVQMNAINLGHSSVIELLSYLGPYGTTVENQIEQQLENAIQKVKNNLSLDYQRQFTRICTGLASLPPNIPLEVLSRASGVNIEDVKSFIADIGRSLWLLDSSVQFRDEPTETWFRSKYTGSKGDYNSYIKSLEPLATELTYVAEVLPQLYLQAGQYDELIDIALSNRLLPSNNPIDTRNVLVYRLQFAFKAALKAEKFVDSIKLALRAGEEVAGDQRQQLLFQSNIDLLSKLQDKLKVQDIAFKGFLRSGWEGSENVYTASLLSEIEEYRGEANSYLRSALNWLQIYFQEANKRKEIRLHAWNEVSQDDILEIAFTKLNVSGIEVCLKFLNDMRPKELIFQIMQRLINRLIDAGRFNEIDKILQLAKKNTYFVLAIVSELVKVGRFTQGENLTNSLSVLANPKKRIQQSSFNFNDTLIPAIISFLEACLHRQLNTVSILKALDHYFSVNPTKYSVILHDNKERVNFLKALSIRNILSKEKAITVEELIEQGFKHKAGKRKYHNYDERQFREVIGSLMPWYQLRVKVISGEPIQLDTAAKQANELSIKASIGRYRFYDTLPYDISYASSSILRYCSQQAPDVVRNYYDNYLKTNSAFTANQRISLLRTSHRALHLNEVMDELEHTTYEFIKSLTKNNPEETAALFISLARAVLNGSKNDAAAYFEEAINVVSKFGDEIIERWEALDSLGEKSAGSATDQLAYRFIRCAELVGENVYKEKHWDRSGALITCTSMSPQIGISAFSRWRDREVGSFEFQLESLLIHLVKSELIQPAEGWSMNRLFSCHALNSFLSVCLSKANSEALRMRLFSDAYELLSKAGSSAENWKKLKATGDQYKLRIGALDTLVNYNEPDTGLPKKSDEQALISEMAKKQSAKWEQIFNGAAILQPEGLSTLLDRFIEEFKNQDVHQSCRPIHLYLEALTRITASQLNVFIDALLRFERIDYYEFQQVLSSIPINWTNKISFKKKLPEIIKRFGSKYSHELTNRFTFQALLQALNLNESLKIELKKGIFYGLSERQKFNSTGALFGFVNLAANFVSSSESAVLLDFALSRFELHIADDYADGQWGEWLQVPNDVNSNLAGFIWSALGSPRSETRWQACHVVKTLADFNCTQLLACLVEWMTRDKVGAFGSHGFPFYNLHARQYLLISLARVSIDHPGLLACHKDVFLKYAMAAPHVLIQKYSAAIALRLEMNFPATYKNSEILSLKKLCQSDLEPIVKKRGVFIESYLHKRGEVDTSLEYRFSWDFEKYWCQPLGEVFGVSGKQITELCANHIIREWKIGEKKGFKNDPRVNLWNGSKERETWHSHGRYPKTDNWDFYLSYHALLCVAAKLIQNMPVISSKDTWHSDEPWEYWISRHVLTRADGRWLADSRGALPLERPEWTGRQDKYEEWRSNIIDQNFLHGIKSINGSEVWLNISGEWTERYNSKYETYSISAALVSKNTSRALQRALETCSNCHDYKLPNYQEDWAEIASDIFMLKGFINNPDLAKGLDELDPYAANLSYPPISLGAQFSKELELTTGNDGKTWCLSDGQVALKFDTWSSGLETYDKEPEQYGMRLSASTTLLKRLCKKYGVDLIIDVNISRDITYKYKSEKLEYAPPRQKIYIFTEDGRLKSSEKDIDLR